MPENHKYLALYMRNQAERLRATIEDLTKWAADLDDTAEWLEEEAEKPESQPSAL